MSDGYKRKLITPNIYQCGCKWQRSTAYGDVLVECIFHQQVTNASYRKFEEERQKKL